MKMREYVDNIKGEGYWDKMLDLIAEGELWGWTMPDIPLDGGKVYIFPGENREVTLEEVQAEIRRTLNNVRGDNPPWVKS